MIISKRGRELEQKAQIAQIAQHAQEYAKCKADPLHFIKTYLKPNQMSVTQAPFALWDIQRNVLDKAELHSALVIKHPRQAGMSTVLMGLLVWEAIFGAPGVRAVMTSNVMTARHHSAVFRDFIAGLPAWLNIRVAAATGISLHLSNKNTICFSSVTDLRGITFVGLYVIDFALTDPYRQDRLIMELGPHMHKLDRVVIASTPNTGHDTFAKVWKQAKSGSSQFVACDYGFWHLPNANQHMWDTYVNSHGIYNAKRDLGGEFPS